MLLAEVRSTLPDEQLVSRVDVFDALGRSCSSSAVPDHTDYVAAIIRDKIAIGETTLLFMPLCGPDFDWSDLK